MERASRTIRNSTREIAGVDVKPGVYKLKITFGELISEQNIKVEFDPRLQISEEAINQKYDASKTMERHQEKMAAIVKQLVESKNTATTLKVKLEKEDAKKYKSEITTSKEIIKKVDGLIAMFLGKIDKRQGITRNPEVTVIQRFYSASRYVGSRFGNLTTTETQLIKQYKDALSAAVKKSNDFFETQWTAYKSKVETISISPFKEIKKY